MRVQAAVAMPGHNEMHFEPVRHDVHSDDRGGRSESRSHHCGETHRTGPEDRDAGARSRTEFVKNCSCTGLQPASEGCENGEISVARNSHEASFGDVARLGERRLSEEVRTDRSVPV